MSEKLKVGILGGTGMANELRVSDFAPLSFELDFGKTSALPPLKLGEGEDSLILTGIADRVDGWLHDGKLYLRVVDYKTGRKSFSWICLRRVLYSFSSSEIFFFSAGFSAVPSFLAFLTFSDLLMMVSMS